MAGAAPGKATEYPVGRPHGVCHVSGQAIDPGQVYYAALRETPDGFERLEFLPEAWTSWPPEERAQLLAFWRTEMASREAEKRKLLVDDEVLAELFRRLAPVAEPEKLAFRFMLGLILMRKKKLVFEGSDTDSAGRNVWRMRFRKEEEIMEVIDPKLGEEQLEEVGRQVGQILHGGIEEVAFSGEELGDGGGSDAD